MFANRVSRQLFYQNKRLFSVTQKLAKAELTVRTPYRTIFENFAEYTRIYVWTIDGLLAIGNRSNPRVYLLPPGEMEVTGMDKGEGNNFTGNDGKLIHSGGWLFVHENNSIEVNFVDASEKEDFDFDKLTLPDGLESDSAAGKVAAQLQEKTFKRIMRVR
ncbi:unnamed protein product [Moneuplotes crassus]|uniref:Uncharacterized protein n=2 Tax=Euplotes crassus TaxID=5936 RepID=A0AAD1Y0B6_EUPCR|nr:unnamed protein product [Moneuplotes crassus]